MIIKSKLFILCLILIFLFSACSLKVPEDFEFEVSYGDSFLPYSISTVSNTFYHYDMEQGFIIEDLNLSDSEQKEIYKEMKVVFESYPNSFDLKREMMDDGEYRLKVSMNSQSKSIYVQGEDGDKDGIAKLLLMKIERIYIMIVDNRTQ